MIRTIPYNGATIFVERHGFAVSVNTSTGFSAQTPELRPGTSGSVTADRARIRRLIEDAKWAIDNDGPGLPQLQAKIEAAIDAELASEGTTSTEWLNFASFSTSALGESPRTAWSNPGSASFADSANASVFLQSFAMSQYLIGANPSPGIPQGASIQGVEVRTTGRVSQNSVNLNRVVLLQGSTVLGAKDAADLGDDFTTLAQTHDYGAADDLWGATLTPSVANGATFGVGLRFINGAFSETGTAFIDQVQARLHYA